MRGEKLEFDKRPVLGRRYLVGKTIGEVDSLALSEGRNECLFVRQGTFARVKYGEDTWTHAPVAVKVLSKRRLAEAGLLENIDAEVTVARRLKHPHVVDVQDVRHYPTTEAVESVTQIIIKNEKICIIMEYVDGGTLFDKVVREGPLEESAARRIFEQLLDALDDCHRQGIFHRDLKPENVLLTKEGNVKLSDFGLSGFLTEQTGENRHFSRVCGTPNYTAPEILQRKQYLGAPADVWSLGVMLFVILVGKLPFREGTLPKLFQKIVTGAYEMPESLSPSARSLLRRMLQPQPAKRIRLKEILKHAWVTSGHYIEKTDVTALDRCGLRRSSCSDSASDVTMKRIRLDNSSEKTNAPTNEATAVALSEMPTRLNTQKCTASDSVWSLP